MQSCPHRREAGRGSCLRRRRSSCREPERQPEPPGWSRHRRRWRLTFGSDFGRDFDPNSDRTLTHEALNQARVSPGLLQGAGALLDALRRGVTEKLPASSCVWSVLCLDVLCLDQALDPRARNAPRQPQENGVGSGRGRSLFSLQRSLPPAEAKAISGHSVSRSPPAVLAV